MNAVTPNGPLNPIALAPPTDLVVGEASARAAGVKMTRRTYRDLNDSLRLIIETMREGRDDPRLRGWAGTKLIAAGRPQRILEQAQVLVTAFRGQTQYVSDPIGSEFIAKPYIILCLEKDQVCIPIFDCDEGLATVGSALMGIGIAVQIVVQTWNDGRQPHVLLVFEDEGGRWVYADPGGNGQDADPVHGLPVGSSPPADNEEWYDPMEAHAALNIPAAEPKLVGVGRAARVASAIGLGARRVGLGATADWVMLGPADVVTAGDIIRGSVSAFQFDAAAALIPGGPLTTDAIFAQMLPVMVKPLCSTPGPCAIWSRGEKLPDDWPTDDPNPGGYHFRGGPLTDAMLTRDLVTWPPPLSWTIPGLGGLPAPAFTFWIHRVGGGGGGVVQPPPKKAPPPPGDSDLGLLPVIGAFAAGAAVVGIGWALWRRSSSKRGRR